jgi:hypothetical protein
MTKTSLSAKNMHSTVDMSKMKTRLSPLPMEFS